ncbi:HPr(Ser) kinase/phosphatase [Proteinivorax hydrogeniformans]|uniref:HPr kinase/phosphorylase n=1 Tax=Proteinivorax hydrogeniformans TaxID=1826727 RepID=A0AAU8HWH0_9FIRM
MKKVTVKHLTNKFKLGIFWGESILKDKYITVKDISRPALELAGYDAYYPKKRIQVLGKTELTFLASLDRAVQKERFKNLLLESVPCIILTRGFKPTNDMLDLAAKSQIPILGTDRTTTDFIALSTDLLDRDLAPTKTIHGVLVDIYGVGVLIKGQSGIGKSETALELIKRGHRLVSDDAVELRGIRERAIVGAAPKVLEHLLEIRGVGLINVVSLFGTGCVRSQKTVDLVINLEHWDEKKSYERLGLDRHFFTVLGVDIEMHTIPVAPGRNLAIIMEIAAMNHRAKKLGTNTPEDFTNNLNALIKGDEK